MTFRPINSDLISVCNTQSTCLLCPSRTGCPVRYSFYHITNSDIEEILTGIAKRNPNHSKIPEDKLKELCLTIKYKRAVELVNHPRYKYGSIINVGVVK